MKSLSSFNVDNLAKKIILVKKVTPTDQLYGLIEYLVEYLNIISYKLHNNIGLCNFFFK